MCGKLIECVAVSVEAAAANSVAPPEAPPCTGRDVSPTVTEPTSMSVVVTDTGTQTEVMPTQVTPAISAEDRRKTIERLGEVAGWVGRVYDFSEYISAASIRFQPSGAAPPRIHGSNCSWNQHYSVLSFLVNGHLRSEYERLSGWLGFPPCSSSQWQRILGRLEPHVTKLAEWSCGQVQQQIVERGDAGKWVAAFDGFYLTRGHYSNNSSATIHDYEQGGIAWFTHQPKRGRGHNWVGTTGAAEGDMFDELLGKVKDAGFNIGEIITDKDTSTNVIFCRHFPEGMITYCSNHCAKTLHKDLEKIKKNRCEVCK